MDKEEEYESVRQELQANTVQKQNLQLQYNELRKTIQEVEKNPEGEDMYELVGQILIKKDKRSIQEGLKDKIDILDFRLKTLDRSLANGTERLQELQKELDKGSQ